MEREKRKGKRGEELTGSQDSLLNLRVVMSSPVVMAFMEPVTAMDLRFLPYFFALFNSSSALSNQKSASNAPLSQASILRGDMAYP